MLDKARVSSRVDADDGNTIGNALPLRMDFNSQADRIAFLLGRLFLPFSPSFSLRQNGYFLPPSRATQPALPFPGRGKRGSSAEARLFWADAKKRKMEESTNSFEVGTKAVREEGKIGQVAHTIRGSLGLTYPGRYRHASMRTAAA